MTVKTGLYAINGGCCKFKFCNSPFFADTNGLSETGEIFFELLFVGVPDFFRLGHAGDVGAETENLNHHGVVAVFHGMREHFMECCLTAADFQRSCRQVADVDTADFSADTDSRNVENDIRRQVADSTVVFDVDGIKISRRVGFKRNDDFTGILGVIRVIRIDRERRMAEVGCYRLRSVYLRT